MEGHNKLGKIGEDVACRLLEEKHYLILQRNWRVGKLEVDIIARHGDIIVFVEVKARSTDFYGYPESFVGVRKMQNIVNAAEHYIEMNGIKDLSVRFDVVSVVQYPDGIREVLHIEDAFCAIDAFGSDGTTR